MRRLAACLALVLTASVLVASTASSSSARRPSGDATFNVPRPWGSPARQNAILLRIERAINNVPKRSKRHPEPTIAIATHLLDRTTSVTAIINACKRGVGVRVVLDNDIINRNSRRLISALNGDNVTDRNNDGKPDRKPRTGKCGRPRGGDNRISSRGVVGGTQLLSRRAARASLDVPTEASFTWGRDRSYVKRCKGSCRNAGKGGNMHSKIYLFSRTGKYRHVVMVSSSNLNRGGAQAGWNDLFVMRDLRQSYTTYLKVHRAMTKEMRASRARVEVKDGPFTSRFFPMRKASKRNDPTLRDLKQIKCKSAFGPTQVHVSMFYWKGVRGNYLTDQLLTLARAGCRVSVIYGAPSRQMAERLRAAAGAGTINLFDSRWDHNEDGYNEVRTHGKFVLVKGNYRGDNSAWVVMTGSPNWVQGSLSLSDENTVNIALKSAYQAYRHEWEVVRAHSRRLPYA
jgi:PLD-like domain